MSLLSDVNREIKAGVIGAGAFGRLHAQKYASLPGVKLIGIADADVARAQTLANDFMVTAYPGWRSILPHVEVVTIATPARFHGEIGVGALNAGKHVFVEKPLAANLREADALVRLAEQRNLVLHTGHQERFVMKHLGLFDGDVKPLKIECHRASPFSPRNTDVSVVLDLMIHDIDIVQAIVGSPIASLEAVGAPVFSDEIDIANARIRFENGCVANTTASRVSLKTERKLRLFEDDAYLSIDLQQRILTVIRKRAGGPAEGQLPVTIEEQNFEQGDALRAEIESFLECARHGKEPVVSGEDGLRALETAIRITEEVAASAHRR